MRRLRPEPIPVGCGSCGNGIVLARDAITKAIEDDKHGGFFAGGRVIHSRGHWGLSTKWLVYRDLAPVWGISRSDSGPSSRLIACCASVRKIEIVFVGVNLARLNNVIAAAPLLFVEDAIGAAVAMPALSVPKAQGGQ